MKISLPNPFKKKEKAEKAEKTEKAETLPKELLKEEKVVFSGDIPRYKSRPQLVFIGSGKGGVGKSFIASNIAIVAGALSPPGRVVYAVDLDLDNYTLSTVIPPPKAMQTLIKQLRDANLDYLNLAMILHEGVVPQGVVIPRIRGVTTACNGAQIRYDIRLIPAYNLLKMKEQQTTLRSLDSRLLREGIDALLSYFISKKYKNEDFVVFFDGKQKSNIGIEFEPLYKLMIEQSDVFILVTEPPYLVFSNIMAPYRNAIDKTILVVNKFDLTHRDGVLVLMRDAMDNGIPVFIMPKDPADEEIYRNNRTSPAASKLSRRTSIHTMALAYYLNLISDEQLQNTGCGEVVYTLLKKMSQLYSSLTKT